MVVRDSVTISKNLRVEEDVHFLGQTRMNNAKIQNNFDVEGNTRLEGNVWLTEIGFTPTLNNKDFIVSQGNGALKKIPYDTLVSKFSRDLIELVYDKKECPIGVPILNPTWANGPDKIFTDCPQVFVGIGTSEPQSKLDVRGTTYTNSLAINANPTALGSKHFHLKVRNLPPSQQNSTIFLIENNDRPLFQINNDGIVRAREIKVNLDSAWPDYVFQPNYSLQPLTDVHRYIQENGHLPNVPSAQEIEEEGVSLGEMNRILVEKVEELTLYLIEQQKLIEAQNLRLNELETKNK